MKSYFSMQTGLFLGHIIYTFMFVTSGLWRMYCNISRYFFSKRSGTQYQSKYINPFPFWRRVPLESGIKVCFLFSTIALCGYKYLLRGDRRQFHHFTMYSLHLVQFSVEMATYLRLPLPPGSEYMSAAFMCGLDGVAIAMHLNGPGKIEQLHHFFVLVGMLLSAVTVLWSYGNRTSLVAAMSFDFVNLLLGTWLLQTSVVVFPLSQNEPWNSDDEEIHKTIMMSFTWHCEILFIFVLAFYYFLHRRFTRLTSDFQAEKLIIPSSNGHSCDFFQLNDDNDLIY